jgi:hypothetical protein
VDEEITALLADADDDHERLRRLAAYIREHDDRAERARAARIEIAARMRDEGVAMQEIAESAGVDDSYLSRVLLKTGMTPRVRRAGRR